MSKDRLLAFAEYIQCCLPRYITRSSLQHDSELHLHIPAPDSLLPVLHFLRDHYCCSFRQLIDITCIDRLNTIKRDEAKIAVKPPIEVQNDAPAESSASSHDLRFELFYMLLSHKHASRLILRLPVTGRAPVPSAHHLFSSANWAERELYDMFGILFSGHPDLRRILTDYGFEGHPLRKDFPLSGFKELRYDDEKKSIVYENVELAQEYRRFDLGNAWEQVPLERIQERS